ncbi:MAG: hypothetical protein AAF639_06965 [Chloroflexota bacterium]
MSNSIMNVSHVLYNQRQMDDSPIVNLPMLTQPDCHQTSDGQVRQRYHIARYSLGLFVVLFFMAELVAGIGFGLQLHTAYAKSNYREPPAQAAKLLPRPISKPIPKPVTQTTSNEQNTSTDEQEANRSTPPRVKLSFFINSITNIDEVAGLYGIDFWLTLYWSDPALNSKPVEEVDTSQLWNPKIRVTNMESQEIIVEEYENSFEPETNVSLTYRFDGIYKSDFDLRKFPFDTHTMMLSFESSEFDSNRLVFDFLHIDQEIIYREEPLETQVALGKYLSPEVALIGWSFVEGSAQIVQQIHVLAYDKSSWAQFRIEVDIERDSRPYVLKMMLVIFLFMLLGGAVFFIDVGEIRYRLLALLMLLLTAITFDFTRLQNTPLTTALTILDIQVLLCYFVFVIAALMMILIKRLERREASANNAGQHNHSKSSELFPITIRLNWFFLTGYIVLVLISHIGLGVYGTLAN